MRETRLMQLARRKTGERGALNMGHIDQFLFMLCEKGESAFGAGMIDLVASGIEVTNSSIPKHQLIAEAARFFFKDIVFPDLNRSSLPSDNIVVPQLKPLTDQTYVDYFTALIQIRQSRFNKNADYLEKVLFGFQNQTAHDVCEGIVDYLKANRDPIGFEDLVLHLVKFIRDKIHSK